MNKILTNIVNQLLYQLKVFVMSIQIIILLL